MVRRPPLWLLTCFLLIPSAQAVGQVTPGPRISFEENAVVASGLTAGEKAVWFGVERRIDEEFSTELARRYGLEPVAADGMARIVLKQPSGSTCSASWCGREKGPGGLKAETAAATTATGRSTGGAASPSTSLRPLPGAAEGPAPPAKVKSEDLWIVVDPRKMEISVHKGGVPQ